MAYTAPLNPQPVSGSSVEITGTATSATVALASTDVSAYKSFSLQSTTTFSGVAVVQGSNDNANWTSVQLLGIGSPSAGLNNNFTTSGHFTGVIAYRYLRVNVTSYTSGTVTVILELYAVPSPVVMGTIGVNQLGTWGVTATPVNSLSTGSITSATSSITGITNLNGGGFAQVSISGTHAGITFTIGTSNDSGTTYYNSPVYDTNNNRWLVGGTAITPGTNASNLYYIAITAQATSVRVLASAWTSGTGNIRIIGGQTITPPATMTQDAASGPTGQSAPANAIINGAVGSSGATRAFQMAGNAGDGAGIDAPLVTTTYVHNGSTFDRIRSVTGASTTGLGVLAEAPIPTVASAGLTTYQNQAVTATAITVKSGAARLFEWDVYNVNTSGVWLQIFDATSVTLGTTTPKRTIYIPPSAGRDSSGLSFSVAYTTGLTIAVTTTATGSTAPTSSVMVYLGYV